MMVVVVAIIKEKSMREKVDPVITTQPGYGGDEITVERHPSYGSIVATRVTGHSYLFGSSILHHNYINIVICKAHKYRSLHHDRFHRDEEIVSVNLSPVQFADLIANMNHHDGVPCTLDHVNLVTMPECPCTDKKAEHKSEVNKAISNVTKQCEDLIKSCRDIIINSKMKKSDQTVLLKQVDMLVASINSSLPFLNDTLSDSFEEVVSQAKGEIDAAIGSAIAKVGLATLNAAIGSDGQQIDGSFFIEDKR